MPRMVVRRSKRRSRTCPLWATATPRAHWHGRLWTTVLCGCARGCSSPAKLLLAAKSVPIAIKSEALSNDREPDSRIRAFGVKFEVRNVEIGANDPQFVEVISGLRDGDVYAAKNSFVIKAELAKGLAEEEGLRHDEYEKVLMEAHITID